MPRIVRAGLIQAGIGRGRAGGHTGPPQVHAGQACRAHRGSVKAGCGSPVPAGTVHQPLLPRRTARSLASVGGADSRRPNGSTDAGPGKEAPDGHGGAGVRGGNDRPVLQHRRRPGFGRVVPRQVPQEPPSPRRAGLLGEVLFPSGQSGLPLCSTPLAAN